MTEPAPGAGSDPDALATTAIRVPGGWRIDGRRWFTTGADGAAFAIVMARTTGAPGDPVRPFRIYDGPSETHRWSIARRAVRRITAEAHA